MSGIGGTGKGRMTVDPGFDPPVEAPKAPPPPVDAGDGAPDATRTERMPSGKIGEAALQAQLQDRLAAKEKEAALGGAGEAGSAEGTEPTAADKKKQKALDKAQKEAADALDGKPKAKAKPKPAPAGAAPAKAKPAPASTGVPPGYKPAATDSLAIRLRADELRRMVLNGEYPPGADFPVSIKGKNYIFIADASGAVSVYERK